MMRKFLLTAAFLLSCLALPAQTAREFKTANDSLRARLHRRTTVDSFLRVSKVTKRGTTLDFHFSKELGDYPWRAEDVEWFRKELLDLFPSGYRAYALGNVFADKNDLATLPMPAHLHPVAQPRGQQEVSRHEDCLYPHPWRGPLHGSPFHRALGL